MLIYNRLACFIVILAALFNVLSVVMAGHGKCSAPVPKHFMTSSCKCLTFARKSGSSKLTTDRCDSDDRDQWIQVTKIGKTEAVFHNEQNNRFICYDVAREKFILVDREELEEDAERARLRRKLNKLLRDEEKLIRDLKRSIQEDDHQYRKSVKDLENLIQRRTSSESGGYGLRKQKWKGYRPKRRRRKGRKKKSPLSRELKRKERKLKRVTERIQLSEKLLEQKQKPSLCKEDAMWIKSVTGGHQRRVRHPSNRPRRESLVCTLHEVNHGTGENTIYAEVFGGVKAYMRVKHGKIRSLQKSGNQKTPKGEFLHISIGYGMC